MSTIKKVFWAVLATAAALLGAVLLGKFKKLKRLEVEAKVNKANEALKGASDKYNKAKEKSNEAVNDYRNALRDYGKHRDS